MYICIVITYFHSNDLNIYIYYVELMFNSKTFSEPFVVNYNITRMCFLGMAHIIYLLVTMENHIS